MSYYRQLDFDTRVALWIDRWRARQPSGGNQPPGPASRAVTLRKLDKLPPMPSGSVAVFKPSDLDQPPSYKFSALDQSAISFVTGAALVLAGCLLLLV